jgi:cell wall-associated NlpC family hydrolase
MAVRVVVIRSRRFRSRYRRQGSQAGPVAIVAVAALLASAGAKAAASHGHARPSAGNQAAPAVVAFARARVGKVPYAWGGTTDAGMDCSGLTQAAYASAGVTIERTSQQQWASEQHVPASQVTAGDLVFFAGSDGTPTSPGHVGIVTDPARHQMIDAYGAGTYVRYDGYGPAASPGTGLSAVTGFTDPAPAPQAARPSGQAAANRALGQRMASAAGWGSGPQWSCLDALWTRESGWLMVWNYQGSGAYGIAQALPASKMASAGPDYMTSPATQVRWGLGYIASRYGTPCGAQTHEEANGWY